MMNDNVLTPEARATIMDACQSISRSADGVKAGCAIGDEWPDAEDKAFYDAELRLLARLVALLNDSGRPEPRAEVTEQPTECPQCGARGPKDDWLCPRSTNPNARCARAGGQ